MNQEIKGQWLQAMKTLRQARGCMHKIENGHDFFCPLGMLVNLYQRSSPNPLPQVVKAVSKTTSVVAYGEGDIAYLPEEVRVWAGLDSRSPSVTLKSGNKVQISTLNDRGDDLEYIAYVIACYLE